MRENRRRQRRRQKINFNYGAHFRRAKPGLKLHFLTKCPSKLSQNNLVLSINYPIINLYNWNYKLEHHFEIKTTFHALSRPFPNPVEIFCRYGKCKMYDILVPICHLQPTVRSGFRNQTLCITHDKLLVVTSVLTLVPGSTGKPSYKHGHIEAISIIWNQSSFNYVQLEPHVLQHLIESIVTKSNDGQAEAGSTVTAPSKTFLTLQCKSAGLSSKLNLRISSGCDSNGPIVALIL